MPKTRSIDPNLELKWLRLVCDRNADDSRKRGHNDETAMRSGRWFAEQRIYCDFTSQHRNGRPYYHASRRFLKKLYTAINAF